MPILLDHLIVPSHDKAAGARFLGELLGVPWEPGAPGGPFAPVYINETLTMDFADRDQFASHHYCFHVSDEDFDAIFKRVQEAGIEWGSDPWSPTNRQLNHRKGGRGVYFRDLDGHMLELLTRT